MIHLFGTDDMGHDIFSRTHFATGTSLSIGILGVILAFILALIIGGIACYFGGWIDYMIQRLTEIVRVVTVIPHYMVLAASFPREWSNMRVYLAGVFGRTKVKRRQLRHELKKKAIFWP